MSRISEKVLDNYEIISFDLYGTLINRLVQESTDVFKILENRFLAIYGKHIDGFMSKRIDAERFVRSKQKGNINLNGIYARIEGLSEKDKRKCIDLEKRIEYDLAYPNRVGVELYRNSIKNNKRTIIITDMYLPEDLIRKILEKCGIKKVERIYISGYIGKSKADKGALFKTVSMDLKVSPEKILHIGDNYKSDIINARKEQMNTKWIYNNRESAIKRYVRNTKICCVNQDEVFGYTYFGALTLGYITWLYEMCQKENIKSLYFFSREGFFFKKIFDMLFGTKIQTTYLYVSRKSLSVPLFQFVQNYEELKAITYIDNSGIIVKELLDKLGIGKSCVIEKLASYHISMNLPVCKLDKELFFKIIKKELHEISKEQFANIKQYFEKSISGSETKIGIVDIGWTGSMQNNFVEILHKCNRDIKVIGFFMGQKGEIKEYIKNGLINYGYLFEYQDKRKRDLIISGCSLFEMVYFADHGSTSAYGVDGPLLQEGELPLSTKIHLFSVQTGIIKFIGAIGRINEKYGLITRGDIIEQLKPLFTSPDNKLLDEIGDWELYDTGYKKLACRNSIFSINAFFHEFLNSNWKVGYLKRNLRISIPYYEIVNVSKKVRKMVKEPKEMYRIYLKR